MSFVDRISDLDAFILLCYGNPNISSLCARTKDEAVILVKSLSEYLCIDCLKNDEIIESIIYMDNLGIMWVNEKQTNEAQENGKDLVLKEFSSFRTPLGDAVATMISPPGFYLDDLQNEKEIWPDDHISKRYKNIGY